MGSGEGPGPLDPETIEDEEWLTQYGTLHPETLEELFPSEPRWAKENDLSLLRGWWEVEDATSKIRGRYPTQDADAVRYTTAGTLRESGFLVTHTPRLRNRAHVSVTFNGDWDERVCQALNESFTDAGQD